MGRKTPPFKNYNGWTTARFFGFIRSALRNAYSKYPPRFEALKRAEVGRMINSKTGKLAKHYECNHCRKYFIQKDVQVDHIIDAGSLRDFSDLPGFCERLFCGVDGLQVLCKKDHQAKTKKTHKKK